MIAILNSYVQTSKTSINTSKKRKGNEQDVIQKGEPIVSENLNHSY